jgi:hypothetical protein
MTEKYNISRANRCYRLIPNCFQHHHPRWVLAAVTTSIIYELPIEQNLKQEDDEHGKKSHSAHIDSNLPVMHPTTQGNVHSTGTVRANLFSNSASEQ